VPVVDGVLENGPGGVAIRHKWSLVCHLMPWTANDGAPLPTRSLRVEIAMAEPDVKRWMTRFRRGDAVRLVTGQIGPSPNPHAPWWLARAVGPPEAIALPTALIAAKHERDLPVVIRGDLLGKLTLDRSLRWFDGRVTLWNRRVAVSVQQSAAEDDRASDERDAARAEQMFSQVAGSRTAIEGAIIRELLPLYNDGWRDRRPVLTGERLIARIRVRSLAFERAGTATLHFADGGLFRDHVIQVSIAEAGQVSAVTLAG
jgi:hypothetical protein